MDVSTTRITLPRPSQLHPGKIELGRCAAVAIPDGHAEKLVVIIEVTKRGGSDEEVLYKFDVIKGGDSPRRYQIRTPLASRSPCGATWFESDEQYRQDQSIRLGAC